MRALICLALVLVMTACAPAAPREDGRWWFARDGVERPCRLDAGRLLVFGAPRAAMVRAVSEADAQSVPGAVVRVAEGEAMVVAVAPRLALPSLAELGARLAAAGVSSAPILVEDTGLAWVPGTRVRLTTTDADAARHWLAVLGRPATEVTLAQRGEAWELACSDGYVALAAALDLRQAGLPADPLPLVLLP